MSTSFRRRLLGTYHCATLKDLLQKRGKLIRAENEERDGVLHMLDVEQRDVCALTTQLLHAVSLAEVLKNHAVVLCHQFAGRALLASFRQESLAFLLKI